MLERKLVPVAGVRINGESRAVVLHPVYQPFTYPDSLVCPLFRCPVLRPFVLSHTIYPKP